MLVGHPKAAHSFQIVLVAVPSSKIGGKTSFYITTLIFPNLHCLWELYCAIDNPNSLMTGPTEYGRAKVGRPDSIAQFSAQGGPSGQQPSFVDTISSLLSSSRLLPVQPEPIIN